MINGKRLSAEVWSGYQMFGPALLILGVFLVLPIAYALFLAMHKVELLGAIDYQFVGLRNFWRLQGDERVWIALKNTVQYVAFVVPTQTILALGLAAVINSKIKGQRLFQVLYFLPTITSSAVLTLIFMWIYNRNGLLNTLLEGIGLPTYNWLGDPAVALKAIMLMNIWATAPLFMVIYLAALQEIPEALYEAARIDGANAWEQFWYITLPGLRSVTLFVVVMGVIGTFQLFDQSYIFSGGSGGPNNSTLTVVLLIYQYAFKSLDMGYAAAIAFLLATVIILVTLLQRTLLRQETFYE